MELARAGTSSAEAAEHHHQPAQDRQPAELGNWLCCMPCYWLRRNDSVHKASLTVATLLVTSLLVASPVIFLISSVPGGGDLAGRCFHQDDDGCAADEEAAGARAAPGAAAAGAAAQCRREACEEAAARALASAALSQDPCHDFYQFACGGWLSGAGPPDMALSLASLQRHVDLQLQHLLEYATNEGTFYKLGVFYKSCLQTKKKNYSTKPMFSLLDELGGYLPPGAASPEDLTPLVARLLLVQGAPLFDVYLDRDQQDLSRLAVHVDLPRRRHLGTRLLRLRPPHLDDVSVYPLWHLISPDMQRRKRNSNKESRAYTYMKDSAEERRLLGMESLLRGFLPANMPPDMRAKEAQSILLFASMLTKTFPREKDIINRSQQRDTFKKYNISELQESFKFVQWKVLLDELFAANFTDKEAVYVGAPNYLADLQRLLAHFQHRVVHNALLVVYARDVLHELVNGSTVPDRPAFCTRLTCGVFSRAMSALYVRQFDPRYLQDLGAQVSSMFEHIKATLLSRMKHLAWLDEATRAAAVRKLKALAGQFSTWPLLWNETYVDTLLHDVQVDEDDFFGNVIRRYRYLRKFVTLDFRTQPQDDQKWAVPFLVNAFYEKSLNTIVVPLAMLAQPYFLADAPRYVSYATAGLVLAHEVLHGFDMSGAGQDVDGSAREWFTPEARLRLEARLDCVARQYSASFARQVSFLGARVDVQFDWNLTRNENMADVSGLQVAYQAWRASAELGPPDLRLPHLGLSKRQLFFLLAAQNYCSNLSSEDYILLVEMDFHTPYPERVNGIMMNSPSFAEAYNCPVGSKMNPAKKCSIW